MASAAETALIETDQQYDEHYYNLIAYIVSNAIAGEIMAIENYSEMVHLMPDTESKIDTVMQAKEECKHILLLSKLGQKLDIAVEQKIVEPQWLAIRKHFSTAVKRGDLAACLIIQDLMTETMAILLYRTLSEEAEADSKTAKTAASILDDELEHLEMGKARLRELIEADSVAVHDALVWAHHRVMPELFTMISTSCHSLCDNLNIDCSSLSLDSLSTDIEQLRMRALELYIETLDGLFEPQVVNPLVASMAAYEGAQSMFMTSADGTPCCGPGASTEAEPAEVEATDCCGPAAKDTVEQVAS